MIVTDPANVLGVSFEPYTKNGLLTRVTNTNTPLWIVTANPEILVCANEQLDYAACLRAADVRVVDGMGLWLVLRRRGIFRPRLTGGELVRSLLTMANQREWTVALIGGEAGIAHAAAEKMRAAYPKTIFLAEEAGHVDQDGREDERTKVARERLITQKPNLVFVAFGHPKQERWIERWRSQFIGTKALVGIGGVLDVWAGKRRPAPRILSLLGLEWLWRFSQEPQRWQRMWRATGGFLWQIWLARHKQAVDKTDKAARV